MFEIKQMDKICKTCQKKTNDLEIHHIVPRSRGGSDEDFNLVAICLDCHSKAHDVNFRGKKGLISSAAKKIKKQEKKDIEWIKDNYDLWFELIMKLYDEDDVKAKFLIYMMGNHFICPRDMKKLIQEGTCKFRRTIEIKL